MSSTVHPVDEQLPSGKLAALGLQHVLVMYAGAVAVPLIVGRALKLSPEQVAMLISADLFCCGLVTLIQSLGATQWFGIKLPVMMGVTFASVAPMVAMANATPGADGARAIFGAIIAAGVISLGRIPVAALPSYDTPTINVSANLPGGSPETMANSVALPLEKQFSTIAGIDSMTSTSSLGSTSITIQFNLDRDIDGAAQDVQSAIAAVQRRLPRDMPNPPSFRKSNPNDDSILLIALSSKTLALSEVNEFAETVLAHGVGGSTDLPIPLNYALVGGVWALILTFAVVAVAWRTPKFDPAKPGRPLPKWVTDAVDSATLRLGGERIGPCQRCHAHRHAGAIVGGQHAGKVGRF